MTVAGMPGLRPFFSLYGSKWRAAPHYPSPSRGTIIEPFAGSAGYSLRYPELSITLIEKDPIIAETWRYLIGAPSGEILGLPDIKDNESVDDLRVSDGARHLIGWWLNAGSAQPKKTPGAWMRQSLERGGKGWTTGTGALFWGPRVRERIASQQEHIRHWVVIEGDYRDAPDIDGTWFVDPPYQKAGKHYRCSSVNYADLAAWCDSRIGQIIVCENEGADWLPFLPWRHVKANESRHGGKVSKEVVWTK